MCLAIPGQVVEIVDEANRLAKVDVAGVRRNVNVGLLDDDGDGGVEPGDWVLIHVGFALSKVDEEEAHATLALLRADGRGVRAGARGAEGERDRVSDGAAGLRAACARCITCGDEAVAMRVVGVDARRGLALCARRATAERRAVDDRARRRRSRRATRCSSTPARALAPARPRRRRRMKFVDEFRDAELGRALAGEILAHGRARPPLQGDGGLRRPHALDLQVRRRRPAARERRARARPGLPGVRDPDGPRRRRHRGRRTSRA